MPLKKNLQNSPATLELLGNAEISAGNIPTKVCVDKLKEGVMVPIKDGGDKKCLVTLYEGQPKIFEVNCPHMGGDLSNGLCTKTKIVCPWHGYSFDKKDGTFSSNPNIGPMSNIRVQSQHFNPDLKINYKLIQRIPIIENKIMKVKSDT